MSSHRFITRSVTTGLAAAAVAASSALAMGPPQEPIHVSQQEQQVIASRGQGAPTPIRGPVTHVEPAAQSANNGSDFDWGDAGIGAGVAGLVLIAFGSVGLAHKGRMGVAH